MPSKEKAVKYIDLESQMHIDLDYSKPILSNFSLDNNPNKSLALEFLSRAYDSTLYCGSILMSYPLKEKCSYCQDKTYDMIECICNTIITKASCLSVSQFVILEHILLSETNISN